MRGVIIEACVILCGCLTPLTVRAQSAAKPSAACKRPAPGSTISEPADLRSEGGVLRVDLAFRTSPDTNGQLRYCYVAPGGAEAPTLRLHPGDLLILRLRNEAKSWPQAAGPSAMPTRVPADAAKHETSVHDPCLGGPMTALATNLHFHGLLIPPVCHEDDVLKTAIQPSDPPFEYRFRIPADQPPGLYWYHPHLHGFTKIQVQGGASGALIVEGIERANRKLAALPERVLIVRDRELENPNAAPVSGGLAPPPVVLDRDGDILNTGTGTGKPARDLSLNFVPVSYPNYTPALIRMKPSQRELWRVLNASAITYLNLQVLFRDVPQILGVVAIDGEPIRAEELAGESAIWQNHLGIPPGGRIEFIVKGPAQGEPARLITRSVNTGPAGENDPTRPLALIEAAADAPQSVSVLPAFSTPLAPSALPWLASQKPVRTRKLYFSEQPRDPGDPKSPMVFMLTVEGQKPAPFDPRSGIPNIIAHQGDVEDWVIENRTQEAHAFHIHQIHFLVLDWFGLPAHESFLRDTVNVPFWDGKSAQYPSVRLRMDFRDPQIVGTFVYHCHILEHEDGGMMGTIRVDATDAQRQEASAGIP
ncbi:MAG: multicopper oxidase family protein [Candidatus Acidiferrales bacterium]